MNVTAKKAGVAILVLAAFFAIFIYAKFDPEKTFFPQCPFFRLTGLKCPGCGSQRALHQLLHFRIGAAFQYNACLILFIPVVGFLALADALRFRYPRMYVASRNGILSWSLFAILMLWWILRNVFGW